MKLFEIRSDINWASDNWGDDEFEPPTNMCPDCEGEGYVDGEKCERCYGEGQVFEFWDIGRSPTFRAMDMAADAVGYAAGRARDKLTGRKREERPERPPHPDAHLSPEERAAKFQAGLNRRIEKAKRTSEFMDRADPRRTAGRR